MNQSTTKTLLLGWDGADWNIINPLLDAGEMPNLEKLINTGVIGNMATLYPNLSPMLWTSIATGKRPFKHGIYGFIEPSPDPIGVRPITNLSRRTRAIWNILTLNQKRSVVVGWWPSHPVENIKGVMVSNQYQVATSAHPESWTLPAGTVHPPRLQEVLARIRVHPASLDEGHILPFVPKAATIDQGKDKNLSNIGKNIAEALTIHTASCAILKHEPWDFAAIYFDMIDHFSHGFINLHPPRLEWVDPKEYDLYHQVLSSAYILQDILLGQLLEIIPQNTRIMLVSDHGFLSGDRRVRSIPLDPTGPAVQHRHYGILVLNGEGIHHDERVYGASVLDVTPTLLAWMGLPVGADMDGKVLLQAFEAPPVIERIPSWDEVEGTCGMHPSHKQPDPEESAHVLQHLAALGYIAPPSPNRDKNIETTLNELDFNLARSYMDTYRHLEASFLLEKLWMSHPDQLRYGLNLVSCFQSLNRTSDARRVLDELVTQAYENAKKARELLIELNQELAEKGDTEPDPKVREKAGMLRKQAFVNPRAISLLMGNQYLAEGKWSEALKTLQGLEEEESNNPDLWLRLARAYLEMRQWESAMKCLQRVHDLDPEDAIAYQMEAEVSYRRGDIEQAAQSALDSIGLIFHNPQAHYLLGITLIRMELYEAACQALETAVTQNPVFPQACLALAYLHQRKFGDLKKAQEYREQACEARRKIALLATQRGIQPLKSPSRSYPSVIPTGSSEASSDQAATLNRRSRPPIIVVSGLPRSGTSLMMQMLKAAGIGLVMDDHRPADEDNPNGYFEDERVLNLPHQSSWLVEAEGKAIKIVAHLLPNLPENLHYQVLFMERPLEEVIRSQRRMLAHRGVTGTNLSDDQLKKVLESQTSRIREILASRRIPTLYVSHHSVLENPLAAASEVTLFLGGKWDVHRMAAMVNPKLWRERS